MTTIEKIRAEIERRIKYIADNEEALYEPFGKTCELKELLSFLDTLEAEQPVEIHIDNPNIEKIDPSIKVETRTDGTGDIDGKAMLTPLKTEFRYGDRLYHYVKTIEDDGKVLYVVKFFGKYKQWWHYEIWSEYEYKLNSTAEERCKR